MDSKCEHKKLKYFEQTNRIVCLDCGMSWKDNNEQTLPVIPYVPPTFPSYPGTGDPMPHYYFTVNWNRIES